MYEGSLILEPRRVSQNHIFVNQTTLQIEFWNESSIILLQITLNLEKVVKNTIRTDVTNQLHQVLQLISSYALKFPCKLKHAGEKRH